jgi:hypothetical protein
MRSRKQSTAGNDTALVPRELNEPFARIAREVPKKLYGIASARAWSRLTTSRTRRKYAIT